MSPNMHEGTEKKLEETETESVPAENRDGYSFRIETAKVYRFSQFTGPCGSVSVCYSLLRYISQ
jgi:hypothetical protein